jgi:hypothetical protein
MPDGWWPDGFIDEKEAFNLLAERRGVDLRAAAIGYVDKAWTGEIVVWELVFGPPYGIDRRPIPRARWGAAFIADAEETEEGRRYGHLWMSHPATLAWGPIHWQGPAAQEAGLLRGVRRSDIDRIWPPQQRRANPRPTLKSTVNSDTQKQIIDYLTAIPPGSKAVDAVVNDIQGKFRITRQFARELVGNNYRHVSPGIRLRKAI